MSSLIAQAQSPPRKSHASKQLVVNGWCLHGPSVVYRVVKAQGNVLSLVQPEAMQIAIGSHHQATPRRAETLQAACGKPRSGRLAQVIAGVVLLCAQWYVQARTKPTVKGTDQRIPKHAIPGKPVGGLWGAGLFVRPSVEMECRQGRCGAHLAMLPIVLALVLFPNKAVVTIPDAVGLCRNGAPVTMLVARACVHVQSLALATRMKIVDILNGHSIVRTVTA